MSLGSKKGQFSRLAEGCLIVPAHYITNNNAMEASQGDTQEMLRQVQSHTVRNITSIVTLPHFYLLQDQAGADV